ncbi:hypothetical protein COV11_00595 [Candidatus Woesearchaeota archaeon CG10_big_fil_rev_8_21_14_0_10_30_7]|nr:MAG: hypothetical protein COV11_00595 [Candidatus Woesearchaeota archaeon CG10_big_fil_rev_8_21_14_0_10_30_7]
MEKVKNKEIQKALREAKKLEKHIISEEEIIKKYKEGINTLERLKKLLEPSWFIKDEHKTKNRRKLYK